MDTGNDTARRDWLILIIGLLAGGWFFFDYANHHPLSFADASYGKQATINTLTARLGDLDYTVADADFLASFKTRSELINELQRKADIEIIQLNETAVRAFSMYYWNLDILFPEDEQEEDENDFEQRDFDAAVSMTLTLNQEGEWLELRNPKERRPQRLLSPQAISMAFDLPENLLAEARIDSVALSTFSYEFDRNLPRNTLTRENGIILIGEHQAERMAGYYLEQTGWPVQVLLLDNSRVVPFDDFEAAELNYLYTDDQTGQDFQLRLLLAPAGSLLAMEAVYPGVGEDDSGNHFIIVSIRILLLLVFAFWVIILLYIRVRLRVLDIKSALLFAVLAGFTIPAFLLFEWLHRQIHIPGTPGVFDIIFLVITIGFSAALVSMVYFITTVIGESITRQNWIEKIRTMDLIRIGHFFNMPVGTVFIHAVSFGLILAAIWSALFWLLPGSYLSVDESFLSDTTYLAPFVRILTIFFYCLVTIQAVFLIFIGQLSGWMKNKVVLAAVAALIFSLLAPVYIEIGPFGNEMILNGIIGLGIGLIYIYRDFLTALLTFLVFSLLIVTANGWVMVSSPDALIFYPSIGLITVFLVFGFFATTRGKSVKELPKYVPDYIEDLAQEERIKQELQIARKVQQSFLPVKKPDLKNIDLAAVCIPAYETGGDYFDFIMLDNGNIAIMVGDVSGKGFQAAFYMTFIKGVLHALCLDNESTLHILNKANKLFRDNAKRGTFISLIYGILNLKRGEFIFSRAGHNPLFYYNNNENLVEVMRPNGLPLGMIDGKRFEDNISESTINLKSGDILILFTDGIVEATNDKGDFYGDNRLKRVIYFHHKKNAEDMVDHILRDVEKFTNGARQHDDMTLLVIKQK